METLAIAPVVISYGNVRENNAIMFISNTIKILRLLCLLFIVFKTTFATAQTNDLLHAGQRSFQQGEYLTAIQHWENALAKAPATGDYTHIDLLLRLSAAYQAAGDLSSAHAILKDVGNIVEQGGSQAQQAWWLSQIGDLLTSIQRPESAQTYLEKAITQARQLDMPLLLSHTLNNYGNLLTVQEFYEEAMQAYQEAAQLAHKAELSSLLVKIQSNILQLSLKSHKKPESSEAWGRLHHLLDMQADSPNKAFYLITLGKSALALDEMFPEDGGGILMQAIPILESARRLAEQYQQERLQAYAYGYLGVIHTRRKDYPIAQQFLQKALFASQHSPDLQYQWEWRQGRLHQLQNRRLAAKESYQQALKHLQQIQIGLGTGYRNARERFYREIRPVYYALADISLQQATTANDQKTQQKFLEEATSALEQLKLVELQNHFSDLCLQTESRKKGGQEPLAPHTAILYPVILPERLELLLTLPDNKIHQIIVPAEAKQVEASVKNFQRRLQMRSSWSFMQDAKKLYAWLIKPIEQELKGSEVDTLIIVPDSYLRMIPFASLHDGDNYLIEKLALVVIPALDLFEPGARKHTQLNVLLSGLSEGVQGFSPLPGVQDEISNLQAIFTENMTLMDKGFKLNSFSQELTGAVSYSIVHIASHGQFARDPQNTFLLTYDDKLTIDQLRQLLAPNLFRKNPVELLTLSACQTAVGDERAALGLAGVALKSGSRSALASLWSVSDESTAVLISDFYKQLQKEGISKAQALQHAQKNLMEYRVFQHPAHWAPFLLIGNWL